MTAPNAPNFLVIGAQKAGTTFLCDKIAYHPEIFFADAKEPMFFQKRRMTKQTFGTYRKEHFPGAKPYRWRGEGSTIYFQAPHALGNIRRALTPDLRVIICLRQPTEKAVSAFFHNWRYRKYPEPISILDAPRGTNGFGPIESSFYYRHVCRWLAEYSPRQIKIILFDRLKKDPAGFVSEALTFLDLPPVEKVEREAVNKGASLVWEGDVLTVTDPKDRWKPAIHLSELQQLHERYLQDIENLEQLMPQLGISHWRDFPAFARNRAEKAAA